MSTLVLALLAALAARQDPARLAYRIAYDPAARDPVWSVTLAGSGFAGAREIVLELENWGEWLRLDGYYLRGLSGEPPLVRRPGTNEWDLAPGAGWDGAFNLRYDLALAELGSPAQERYGALPYRAPSYAYGVSANTLMKVSWSDGPSAVERTFALDAPSPCTVLTGWGGTLASGGEVAVAEETNTLIVCGEPRAAARGEAAGRTMLEVTQWGGEDDVARPLADFAGAFVAECSGTLGSPVGLLRLVLTEPGHGGTRLDGAIALGVPGDLASPYARHFVGHELFHEWLGGRLRAEEGEQMAWFWEGFTEYLSLWHLARAELVPRAWLAERLGDHERELLARDLFGKAAFADPAVSWRDPAVEPLAYGGSALTAFALDVALRAAGEPGLVALVRDLLAREGGRYSLDVLAAWAAAHGLERFWDERFAAPVSSTLAADLVAAGFVAREVPQPLAYVGVRLDRDGPFGTVVAVDPGGPSAGKVAVGDRVSGLAGTRDAIAGAEVAAPEYPFGLAHYDPDAEAVRIDVERGVEHLEIHVAPRRIAGPPATVFEVGPELAGFFR